MGSEVKSDFKNLEKLIKSLKNEYILKVGILGSKAQATHDKESNKTNAEIGTFHEFGSQDGKHPPRRSFLVDSLRFKMQFSDAEWKRIKQACWKGMFDKQSPKTFLEDLGAKCLEYIEEGFTTNGFGMWQPLSDKLFNKRLDKSIKSYNRIEKAMVRGKVNYDKNTLQGYFQKIMHPSILTDTGKLRRSITFKVEKNK